jgi:hypothetical protein
LTWCHTLDPLKGPLEVVWAQVKLLTQLDEAQWSVQVHLNIVANLLDHLCLRLWHAGVLWIAAPTGSKSFSFSLFRLTEKGDLLTTRSTGGTRWTTIDASGTYSEHERSISRSISRHDCLPALLFVQGFLVNGFSSMYHFSVSLL